MKTKFLLLSIIIFSSTWSYAQPDLQWLVFDGFGKEGVNSGNLNVYQNPLNASADFNLQGVSLPNRTDRPNSRNDLFIIYTDGYLFNSRFDDRGGPGIFYNAQDFRLNITTHNFHNTGNRRVAYAYLSHIYDEDDIPRLVKAKSGLASNNTPTVFNIDTTIPTIMSANHDIAYRKDVTLIINLDLLNAINSSKSTLTYNGVESINAPGNIITTEVLRLSNAFKVQGAPSPSFPDIITPINPAVSTSGLNINFPQAHFAYINFKPIDQIFDQYGPDVNGNPRYNAVFTINKGSYSTQWKEAIRWSHDPNFLRVDSICSNPTGNFIVSYHLEFENVSETPATELAAEVTFPETFDLACLNVKNWSAAGQPCSGQLTTNGRTVTFTFVNNLPISRCTETNDLICRGSINFDVMIPSGQRVDLPAFDLRLGTPRVFFNGMPFELDAFYDLLQEKPEWVHAITNGDCDSCPKPFCRKCVIGAILAFVAIALTFISFRRRKHKTNE